MILILDDEVRPDYRYLGPEIQHFTPDSDYHVYTEDQSIAPDGDFEGVIISGSTASVYDEEYDWIEEQKELVLDLINHEVPLLGICFGHQLINSALGGKVVEDRRRSTLVEMKNIDRDTPILNGVKPVVPVLHSDLVVEKGEPMIPIASTEYNEYFCTRHENAPVWTVQFHPEFTQRVVDRPNDWSFGEHTFDDCNASDVLENFAAYCRQ